MPRALSSIALATALMPAAAFAGFPADVPVRGRRTVEDVLDRRLA